jgi:hypothetical protein
MFDAGAGKIGKYSIAVFWLRVRVVILRAKALIPFAGEKGKPHEEDETRRLEMVFPAHLETPL